MWKLCEKHRVTVFYTAPTAIRALMKFGDHPVQTHDLAALRVLGSVGEPINEEVCVDVCMCVCVCEGMPGTEFFRFEPSFDLNPNIDRWALQPSSALWRGWTPIEK